MLACIASKMKKYSKTYGTINIGSGRSKATIGNPHPGPLKREKGVCVALLPQLSICCPLKSGLNVSKGTLAASHDCPV